ncbi:O-linked N-acetylglucosamine transferase family protein [Bradyrhizobium ottawaense]|uniref:O-linked N-acetylglucosamine transferase family protein n=1 Tax=Bradyrhizobium ottawaense TaxID=931866 RepID=UPI00384EA8ED
MLRDAGLAADRDSTGTYAGDLERLRHLRRLQPHQQDFGRGSASLVQDSRAGAGLATADQGCCAGRPAGPRKFVGAVRGLRIAAERVDLLGATLRSEHLASFNRVDICLDPFPQNGGVSTWEALQMGVPVVAKLGNSLPSRAAGSILTALGLPDWVTDSHEAYIEIATSRGSEISELDRLRRELPDKIRAAAASNPVAYGRAVDDAYRAMWRRYCSEGA